MRALVVEGRELALIEVATPKLLRDHELLIRVVLAGVCRTDCYMAAGLLGSGPTRRILGHEIAGIVVARGTAVAVELGAMVSVDPRIACERCDACARGQTCASPGMLGVDVDGGFAEYLRVPAANVVRAPNQLDPRAVAYIEPIAATLAVLDTGIAAHQHGVVVGTGRIAALTARVLALRGFELKSYEFGVDAPPPADSFDFAIETGADTAMIAELVRIVRPGGRVVCKSRTLTPWVLEPLAWIRKQLHLSAAYYGSFSEAAQLLGDPRCDLRSLWATPRPLADYVEVLAEAGRGEGHKLFFAIAPAELGTADFGPDFRR